MSGSRKQTHSDVLYESRFSIAALAPSGNQPYISSTRFGWAIKYSPTRIHQLEQSRSCLDVIRNIELTWMNRVVANNPHHVQRLLHSQGDQPLQVRLPNGVHRWRAQVEIRRAPDLDGKAH